MPKKVSPVPASLRKDRDLYNFLEELRDHSQKASSSPDVSTDDAPSQGGSYSQANVQAIATLANSIKDSLNDLKDKLRKSNKLED